MKEVSSLISILATSEQKKSPATERLLICSALSKPFTILTGGSGTGKTAIASRLAETLKLKSAGNSAAREPFSVGDVVHGERAKYTVSDISSELFTLRNLDGTLLQLPLGVVQEWLDAWDSGKISGDNKVRQNRDEVKKTTKFDSNSHSWESHLTAIAKSGKGFSQADEKGPSHAIVPVGADWTDNRQVLGFVNHLRTTPIRDGENASEHPVYQTTPVLDLLLEATRPGNESFPFFLILDEMNLSHVERYFADFLSVMEQRDGKLTLHSEGPREEENFRLPRYENDPVGVPRTLVYPQNLFVIGTVNVDETTYMFSPKVLDRANVIEFEVKSEEINEFLSAPHEYPEPPKAGEGVAEAFLALAKKARLDSDKGGLETLSEPAATEAQAHLLALFEILKRGRFEFAYRTANEVVRYLKVCRYLAAEESDEALAAWESGGWRNDLDAQIVQKILPKLHGSMGRVGRLLGALTVYCGGATADAAFAYFPGGKDGSNPAATGLPLSEALKPIANGPHDFPKSRRKLNSMIHVLMEEQFVSFIN